MGDHASDVRAGLNVEHVVDMARLDVLTPEERRALLAALGAVPRLDLYAYHPERDGGDDRPQTWRDHSDEGWHMACREGERASEAAARAERAEAALRDIAATRCECGDGSQCRSCYARAALSADADADAEPCAHESREESGGWAWCPDCRHGWPADGPFTADAEPARRSPHVGYKSRIEYRPEDLEPSPAEGDEQPQSLNELSDEWGLCRPPCTLPAGHKGCCNADAHPGTAERWQAIARWWLDKDAEGGRPREADPQGTPLRTGDASVDGGGDDGRSRAIDAAHRRMKKVFVMGSDKSRAEVAEIIDAALASGGVLTEEHYRKRLNSAYRLAHSEKARVRELEAALHGLDPYCPTDCRQCADCNAIGVLFKGVVPDA